MTPAELDLARALVALPGWTWAPGMRVVDDADPSRGWRIDGPEDTFPGDTIPDLTDPATGGAMVGLLPADAYVRGLPRESGRLWCVVLELPDERPHSVLGPTLAIAVARALVALGRAS